MPLMKKLTFNVMTSLIIGIDHGPKRDLLGQLFQELMIGVLAVPINFPFTSFNRSLNARAKIRTLLLDLIHEKRAALERQNVSPQQDLLTRPMVRWLGYDQGSALNNASIDSTNAAVIRVTSVEDVVVVRMLRSHDGWRGALPSIISTEPHW